MDSQGLPGADILPLGDPGLGPSSTLGAAACPPPPTLRTGWGVLALGLS